MVKKLLTMSFLVVLVVLVVRVFLNPATWHQQIRVEDVSRIILNGFGTGDIDATTQEVENIVTWFNSAYDIRDANFVGTTADSIITVVMRNGERFSISHGGKDFEVQRKDRLGILRSYWARQQDIKQLLDDLAKRT